MEQNKPIEKIYQLFDEMNSNIYIPLKLIEYTKQVLNTRLIVYIYRLY